MSMCSDILYETEYEAYLYFQKRFIAIDLLIKDTKTISDDFEKINE